MVIVGQATHVCNLRQIKFVPYLYSDWHNKHPRCVASAQECIGNIFKPIKYERQFFVCVVFICFADYWAEGRSKVDMFINNNIHYTVIKRSFCPNIRPICGLLVLASIRPNRRE